MKDKTKNQWWILLTVVAIMLMFIYIRPLNPDKSTLVILIVSVLLPSISSLFVWGIIQYQNVQQKWKDENEVDNNG